MIAVTENEERNALVEAVLTTAPPECASYIAGYRPHAEQTALLVARALLRAKTVREGAENMFYASLGELMAHLKKGPKDARVLAGFLVRQDKEAAHDELRDCVEPEIWAKRCIAIDVAINEE